MSSSGFCGCDWSRAVQQRAESPGVSEKLETLRREAERQARDFAKHGMHFESMEWATAAKWLEGVK